MMLNIRTLRYARFNSALARAALGLAYQSGRVYRVHFGPLRGLQMYYDRSINFHAVLGLWDSEIIELLTSVFLTRGLLARDGVVADVGANIGYYTMWFSKLAVPNGRVYSFEPSSEAGSTLAKNLTINGVNNAEIVEMACGDHVGTTEFFIAEHHHASSIHVSWAAAETGKAQKITVPMTTLDTFFAPESGRRPPNFIKIDIEGGGTHALPGCAQILRTARPYILIESHTVDEDRAISNVLTQFDYRGYRLDDQAWVEKPEAVHPDKQGVWGTLLLTPAERFDAVASALASH